MRRIYLETTSSGPTAREALIELNRRVDVQVSIHVFPEETAKLFVTSLRVVKNTSLYYWTTKCKFTLEVEKKP